MKIDKLEIYHMDSHEFAATKKKINALIDAHNAREDSPLLQTAQDAVAVLSKQVTDRDKRIAELEAAKDEAVRDMQAQYDSVVEMYSREIRELGAKLDKANMEVARLMPAEPNHAPVWPDDRTREAMERPLVGDRYKNGLGKSHSLITFTVTKVEGEYITYRFDDGNLRSQKLKEFRQKLKEFREYLERIGDVGQSWLIARGPETKPEPAKLKDGDVTIEDGQYVVNTPLNVSGHHTCDRRTYTVEYSNMYPVLFNILALAACVRSGGSILTVPAGMVGVTLTMNEAKIALQCLEYETKCQCYDTAVGTAIDKLRKAMEAVTEKEAKPC